ncbi:hypothetical protein TYRP_014547 [Tyrophagus putrescentiae]|nr:hypothetical protein TYRP_014547 [Tyrophagus putrescentiae]
MHPAKQSPKARRTFFSMPCFSNPSPKPSSKFSHAKKDILNNQRLLVLFKDVENLIELSRHSFSRGGRILQRIDQCIEKMDDIAKEIVLEQGQLKKFLESRKQLEKLALEVSSNETLYR